MVHLRRIAIVLIAWLSAVQGSAQFSDSLAARRGSSFEGYDFLVGYMQNENFVQSSGLRLRLVIATSLPAKVSVQFPGGAATPYSVSANSTLAVVVPSILEMRESEVAKSNLVRVTSDVPIAVYAMNSQYTTSDSYAVIPVSNWGTQYTALSMPNDAYGFGLDTTGIPPSEIRQSEFLVMASEDNTLVDITLTAASEGGIPAGQARRVVLQKGQCYLVKSAPIAPKQGDLTGSIIRSNKPIAVVSGHARTSVPQGLVTSVDSKDHLAEWLMPDQTLTNEYFTTPFYTDARIPVGDVIRIVATQPNTRITMYTERQDLNYVLVNAGDIQTITGVNSPSWIRADKPITIGQYMLTGSVGGSSGYDPSLTIIAPTDKYITRSVFQAPFNLGEPAFATQYQKHFVNLMCDSLARTSLKLDGVNISKSVAPEILTAKFRSSPYFWAVIPISPGKHEITCDTGFFTGTLYGMGYTDSYAHTLGFATIAGKSDTLAPQFSFGVNCGQLTGTVREIINSTSTGIAFVAIDADSTKNYEFEKGTGDASTMNWTARPTNPYKDAQIFIITRDKAGNGRVFRYYYKAPRFTQTTSLQFTAKTENDSLCQRLFVQNPTATDTLILRSVRFAVGNKEFVLNSPLPFPIRVPNKGGVDFSMCFLPRGASGLKLFDTVIFDIGCGLSIRVPLRATTPTSALRVDDVDFGSVPVGDTACLFMKVVNNGTRIATITDAYLSFPTSVFISNASVVLPKQLSPGDSLILRVCFIPTDTFDLKRTMVFENSLALDVLGEVRGRGVMPILVASGIDMGSRRIATFIDSSVVLRNIGTAPVSLRYNDQTGNNAEFLHSLPQGRSITIQPKDSFLLPVRFYPVASGSYSSTLNFTGSNTRYAQVSVPLLGRGTVPVVNVRNVLFDTLAVGASRQIKPACIFSQGNEALTVDTIFVQGPDATSFTVLSANRSFRQIASGDSALITITFNPTRPGLHLMNLVVRHDADKAFFRKESVIEVRGWARDTSVDDTSTVDTTKPRPRRPLVRITSSPSLFACDTLVYTVTVSNSDTIPITITDARLRSNVSADTLYVVRVPRVLKPGQIDTIVWVLRPPLNSGTVRCSVRAGLWSIDTSQALAFQQSIPNIELRGPISAAPNDTVNFRFSGRWERTAPLLEAFSFSASVPRTMVELLVDKGSLTRVQSGRNEPVRISRQGDDIRVESIQPFVVDRPESWTIDIPCLAMLSQQSFASVISATESNDCYSTARDTTALIVGPVCAEDVRRFALAELAVRAVYPVPAGDVLHMDIESKMNDVSASVYAVDVLGRKFVIAEKLFLRKGLNSLIFDTHSLTGGYHRIELRSRDIEYQIPIMFIK